MPHTSGTQSHARTRLIGPRFTLETAILELAMNIYREAGVFADFGECRYVVRERLGVWRKTGPKYATGGWLREEMVSRMTSVSVLAMATAGVAFGFTIRRFPVFDKLSEYLAAWGMLGVMMLAFRVL